MVRKFGVSLDDDVADAVEESMSYGDKRSDRIQNLVEAGLAVEAALDREGYNLEVSRTREIQSFVRQVFDAYDE